MTTRRNFVIWTLGVSGILAARSPSARAPRKPLLLLNHVGFRPEGAKFCLVPGTSPLSFVVRDVQSGRTVHQGVAKAFAGDLGEFCVGDFSALSGAGAYEAQAEGTEPAPFAIEADVYLPAIRRSLEYFALQRCGDSKTGHNAPCHLDDGRREDTGAHQDVRGGWHDACDVRRWVNATIYGMIGLSRVLDLLGPKRIDAARVLDELRWGNQYFLKMQEPDGYVMDYCGGDDGNHFTDNRSETKDDRLIHVQPCELPAQYQFIAAQAAMVRHSRDVDSEYAGACESAAQRCLKWCTERRMPKSAPALAAAAIACAQLHRAVGGVMSRELAATHARSLLALQLADANPPTLRGLFRANPESADPSREINHGNLPLLALCELLETFSTHADVQRWRDALQLHVEHLLGMSARSAFGIIPFGVYAGADPGGNRRIGDYWYRWFMKVHGEYRAADWWVGVNAQLASNGVGLCRAARILRDPRLRHLAQRQLDWILGANPFDASTITGAGRNQPSLYVTSTFKPPTPLLSGGVMTGIGGTASDDPTLGDGSWHTCEYWTPMVCYTYWLMSELLTD